MRTLLPLTRTHTYIHMRRGSMGKLISIPQCRVSLSHTHPCLLTQPPTPASSPDHSNMRINTHDDVSALRQHTHSTHTHTARSLQHWHEHLQPLNSTADWNSLQRMAENWCLAPTLLNPSFSPVHGHSRMHIKGVKLLLLQKKKGKGKKSDIMVYTQAWSQLLYHSRSKWFVIQDAALMIDTLTNQPWKYSNPSSIPKYIFFRHPKWASSCTVWFSVSTDVSIMCFCCRLNQQQHKHRNSWYVALVP